MTEIKKEIFDKAVKAGILILVEPHETRKCKCTLWFDFTMDAMRRIKEGDLVAIHNFNTTKASNVYSLFRLTSVQPRHFALGKDDLKAYPGNLEESARNVFPDFTEQESESTEDITKIYCEAFPINLQYVDYKELKRENLSDDDSLPITGSDLMLVSEDLMEVIYNYGINKEAPTTVKIGSLIKTESVGINVNSEDLIKVHFGLFGYTGAGKSNLVSTLISSILIQAKTNNKFVLFDIMDEYTGLLIDQLLNDNVNSMLVSLGQRYLPATVIKYLISTTKDDNLLEQAAKDILNGMLLPKRLKPHREEYLPSIKKLLKENKIKVIDLTYTRTVEQYSQEIWDIIFDEYVTGGTYADLEERMNHVFRRGHASKILTPQVAQVLIDELQASRKGTGEARASTVNDRINAIQTLLRTQIIEPTATPLPAEVRFSVDQIITELNSDAKKALFILTSDDPNEMRRHAKKIGQYIYSQRSREAIISPIVSFVFDEADEFIPQKPEGTKKESRDIVETLSRRGRKFGLGVGLATQRISYLDTNIMGQPHTYFISKLPREYDRTTVGQSFGLTDDDLKQTLKFKKGEWMLISHDAAGLEGEPIPIHSENAEDRILKFLKLT